MGEVNTHLICMPLQFIYVVETGMHDERVQISGLLCKAWDAIAALLGGPKFQLEGWLVSSIDDTEIVRHAQT